MAEEIDPREVDEALEPAQDEEWVEGGEYDMELFLSTDGKHTVHVKATTAEGKKAAFIKATEIYDVLVKRYGTKQGQAVREYGNGKEAPVCGIHGKPMVWKQGTSRSTGKPYAFWACNEKFANGQYCNFKPDAIKKGA